MLPLVVGGVPARLYPGEVQFLPLGLGSRDRVTNHRCRCVLLSTRVDVFVRGLPPIGSTLPVRALSSLTGQVEGHRNPLIPWVVPTGDADLRA